MPQSLLKQYVVLPSSSCCGRLGRGLVADLFEATVENAPLVDLAWANGLSTWWSSDRQELLNFLGQAAYQLRDAWALFLPGRPSCHPRPTWLRFPMCWAADELVKVEPVLRPLAEWLLGRTWIVDKLDDALACTHCWRCVQFVTLAGELVTARAASRSVPRHGAG